MNDSTPNDSTSNDTTLSSPLDLTITIAAYLEAVNLDMLLPRIHAAVAPLTSSYEILVVDTQQPMDNTAEVCARHNARHIARLGGNSYGDALRTIISETRSRFILNMDADGSHDPAYLPALWAQRDLYDITIGSRYVAGGETENPAILIWMSYVVNVAFRVAFSIDAADVTNSFRLYHRDILTPLRLHSNDFDILEELLIKAAILNPKLRLGEIPVRFKRRHAGESKRKLVQFAFGYLGTLRRLKKLANAAKREGAKQ